MAWPKYATHHGVVRATKGTHRNSPHVVKRATTKSSMHAPHGMKIHFKKATLPDVQSRLLAHHEKVSKNFKSGANAIHKVSQTFHRTKG